MSNPVGGNIRSSGNEPSAPSRGTAVLGADVGGTYARLGWTRAEPGQPIRIHGLRKYTCADYPDLAAILRDYSRWLQHEQGPVIRHAVVAIAGVLDGDALLNSNLAWPVSLSATRRDAGLEHLQLINDFVAVAQALPHADANARHLLHGETGSTPHSPAVVLGPGTGLGVALRLADGVMPSEAGHAALSAGTPAEQEVLRLLSRGKAHIDNEEILSGPGLVTLGNCLCELHGQPRRWQTPAQVIQSAQSGNDTLAAETVSMFCAWLGSLAGDLALTFGARSVFITGGIAGHLARELDSGAFQQRFLAKGVLAPALQKVPVWRIDHGQLGVLGALASYAGDTPPPALGDSQKGALMR